MIHLYNDLLNIEGTTLCRHAVVLGTNKLRISPTSRQSPEGPQKVLKVYILIFVL